MLKALNSKARGCGVRSLPWVSSLRSEALMLNVQLPGRRPRFCDGLSRRQMLRLGTTGLFAGLSLPRLLAAEARGSRESKAKAKACIFIFLEGGPPHQDMWDPKPEAPSEISGPFKTIATKSPGVFFTEHCPN